MSIPPWKFKRDLIAKIPEEITNPSYGCSPINRRMPEHIRCGIVNLDKPSGPTSHEVVAWIKKILNINRAGHGGTLDPKVTGVLPVVLQNSTKIAGVLLLSGKEYVCVMRLHGEAPKERIKRIFNEFVGIIYQRPPLRSSVRRALRRRSIYYINRFEFDGRKILFRIGCQSGTYIRKICFDIGEALGVGAQMVELRRARAGPFVEDENLVNLYDLVRAYNSWTRDDDESNLRGLIQPMESALKHIPKIYLRDSAIGSVCHGAKLAVPGISKLETGIRRGSLVGFFSLKDELVAIGRAVMSTEEMLDMENGIAAETKRVLMTKETYPRIW